MNRGQKMMIAVMSMALITFAAGDLLAQTGRMPRGQRFDRGDQEMIEPGQMRLERMTQLLNLTEEQQTAIGELQEAARKKGLDLRKQVERVRNDLRGEMLKDNPNERAVVQLTEQLGKLRTDLQVNRAKTRLAVRAQLTPEQRDKMILMCRSGLHRDRRGAEGWRGRSGARDGCPCDQGQRSPHSRIGRKPGW